MSNREIRIIAFKLLGPDPIYFILVTLITSQRSQTLAD